jgi:hypothetical protein
MYTTDRVSKVGDNFDELDYWRLEQSRYPHLSRMARKFLMICAVSTTSKRCELQSQVFELKDKLKVIRANKCKYSVTSTNTLYQKVLFVKMDSPNGDRY